MPSLKLREGLGVSYEGMTVRIVAWKQIQLLKHC